MEALVIPATYDTPEVRFDPLQGQLLLKGRSFSENSAEFFHSLVQWVERYAEMPVSETQLTIDMDVIDESSLKYLVDLLNSLSKIEGKKVQATWLYDPDDEETCEVGEALETLTEISFKVVEKEEQQKKG